MAIMKPQTIVDANVWLEGKHHLGVVKKIKLPSIEFGKIEQKSGGFERELYNGILQKMEGEISFSTFSDVVFKAVASSHQGADNAELLIKGSIYQNGTRLPYVAIWKGSINVEDKELEGGGEVERTIKMNLTFAQQTINGIEEYMIDTDNMIKKIAGVDLCEADRANIM
jgi:P2 family phage contractile tail tube protein